MPTLTRPDGARIHWEARGRGPSVLLAPHQWATSQTYARLADELALDHTVVTMDPRGTGRSTREAPPSFEADVGDLRAVIEEAADEGAVVAGALDVHHRASILAGEEPRLVPAVVSTGATVVSPEELGDMEGLSASPAVGGAVYDLFGTDTRAALRNHLRITNPDMSDEQLRARADEVERYCSPDAIRVRFGWFRELGTLEPLRALGDRLWIGHWPSPWSPEQVAERLRELLPEAHIEVLESGPLSRPDLMADVVRRAVAAAS